MTKDEEAKDEEPDTEIELGDQEPDLETLTALNEDPSLGDDFEPLEHDLDDSDDHVDEDDDDEEDDVAVPVESSDEDDDVDPSDVEAGLDEILRERIASGDDKEDDGDEDEDEGLLSEGTAAAVIAPRRADEWTCGQCFLIVSSTQFGTRDNPRCPSGEDPCPSIGRALKD